MLSNFNKLPPMPKVRSFFRGIDDILCRMLLKSPDIRYKYLLCIQKRPEEVLTGRGVELMWTSVSKTMLVLVKLRLHN